MSWVQRLFSTFPVTSNLYWGIGSILFLAWFWVGEGLWMAGAKNFSAYTYFLRFVIPRPWMIALAISFAAFIVIHFAFGKGYPAK